MKIRIKLQEIYFKMLILLNKNLTLNKNLEKDKIVVLKSLMVMIQTPMRHGLHQLLTNAVYGLMKLIYSMIFKAPKIQNYF